MSALAPDRIRDRRDRWIDRALVAIVAAIAVTLAAMLFADYGANPDLLWRGFYHDRNSHFSLGVDLAITVRNFDPLWFFSELEKSKVWPPFHGLVLSAVLLIAGIDHRFAIVPSLAGWVMTIVFVWLITRLLFRERLPGILAAAIAVIFTVASPAFRLLASDVMLEVLGAGLSAFALWAYLRAYEEPQNKLNWRLLALVLTALFFHKGNYWGLVVAALAVAHVSEDVRRAVGYVGAILEKAEIGAIARNAWRDPLLVWFAIVSAIAGAIYWFNPSPIVFLGYVVRISPPENLVTAAYAILFVRGFVIWRLHRNEINAALGLGGRTIFYWHVLPVAISFLLPKRLSTFLWFIGPSNHGGAKSFDLYGGAIHYWHGVADGFHVTSWMAAVVVAFALLGATQLRFLRPGARVVFLFALISWVAVIVHPQHQSRFLGSWVFVIWICAGTGVGVVFTWVLARRPLALQMLVAGAATVGLTFAVVWQKPSPSIFSHAIHPTSGPSDLDLVRPYLHELEGAREISVATTFGMSRLFRWVIHEHCRCKVTVVDLFIDSLSSRDEVRMTMANRIAGSSSDLFVVIDAPGSRYSLPELGWVYDKMVGVVDAMENQTRYVRIASYPIPSHGAQALLWRLRETADKPP